MQRILVPILLTFMVLGLTTGLNHDVVHAQGEHTEFCDVFKTDTNSTLITASGFLFSSDVADTLLTNHYSDYLNAYSGMSWLQRAPPAFS